MKSTLIALTLTIGCGTLAIAAPPPNGTSSANNIGPETGPVTHIQMIPLFKCGPGFTTYSVKAGENGPSGDGVRCVKFYNSTTVEGKLTGVYWYGEGQWNGAAYRHIGLTYTNIQLLKKPTGGIIEIPHYASYAADISGNGEQSDNEFTNVELKSSSDNMDKIDVTGDWNEIWTMEPSGQSSTYRSKLQPVTSCGSHLKKASVTGSNGNNTGIRCVYVQPEKPNALKKDFKGIVWYGEGQVRGKKYRHFGHTQDESATSAVAADICNDQNYICNKTSDGGLTIYQDVVHVAGFNKCQVKYTVSGEWKEFWQRTDLVACP
jgi:hypothetical protein